MDQQYNNVNVIKYKKLQNMTKWNYNEISGYENARREVTFSVPWTKSIFSESQLPGQGQQLISGLKNSLVTLAGERIFW